VDWDNNTYRSNFILELLMIHQVDPDLMMNMIYEALVNDSDKILNNGQKKEEIESGINQIIAWFEEREQYEQCLKLKQIKERCLESK
jgi:hypothetical protein